MSPPEDEKKMQTMASAPFLRNLHLLWDSLAFLRVKAKRSFTNDVAVQIYHGKTNKINLIHECKQSEPGSSYPIKVIRPNSCSQIHSLIDILKSNTRDRHLHI